LHVVIGDEKGRVGIGVAKARCPAGGRKAKPMQEECSTVALKDAAPSPTKYRKVQCAKVLIKPASKGTVRAGSVRFVLAFAG